MFMLLKINFARNELSNFYCSWNGICFINAIIITICMYMRYLGLQLSMCYGNVTPICFLNTSSHFMTWMYYFMKFKDVVMMMSSNGNIFRRNPPVTGGFSSQRPVTRSFDVFFDLRKQLSQQSGHDQQTVEQTIRTSVISDTIMLIMTSL